MEVKQIYELVNNATKASLGEDATVLLEDLSNLVDIGEEIFNANKVENYARTLIDQIGKVAFVNKTLNSSAPNIFRDAWEYGSVLEKIRAEYPEASENESWELIDGQSYDTQIFYKPSISVKFYNSLTTFEVDMSFTDKQIKSSFTNATQANSFISMIMTAVENTITLKVDACIMRTINNMIAETLHADFSGASFSSKSGVKAVNLLYLYKERFTKELDADDALTDPDFIKFASFTIGNYISRMKSASRLFNINGKINFTRAEDMHVVFLADFSNAANVYLQSETFHNEFTALPKAETVPFWQTSGDSFDFDDISAINVKTPNNNTVSATGILGVIFDNESCGVRNPSRRTPTAYNAKAEFTNSYFKFDSAYFNDANENFVVFFVA